MEIINNQNIDREVPLCLIFSDVDAYIIEENGIKCLIFALTENSKEVYKKNFTSYTKNFGVKLKNKLRQ